MEVNDLTERIIGCAIAVHRTLGPGLLESTYETCLCLELDRQGLQYEHQKSIPIVYRGVQVDAAYRIDLLVERQVVVELKAVSSLDPIHEAQLLTYLKLTGMRVGLLINFNTRLVTRGIRRLVLGPPLPASSALAALRDSA